MKIKIKTSNIIYFLAISLFLGFIFLTPIQATEYTLDNLDSIEEWQINQDINEKRSEIQELNRQVEVYQKNINAKQRQLVSLNNQVNTLDQSIAKINLEVKAIEW